MTYMHLALTFLLASTSVPASAANTSHLLSFKHMRFLGNKQRTDYIAALRLAMKKAELPYTKTLNEVDSDPSYFVIPQNEPSWNYLRLELAMTCVKKKQACGPVQVVTNKILGRNKASE